MLRRVTKKHPGVQWVIDLRVVLDDWWFDFCHRVDCRSAKFCPFVISTRCSVAFHK
jgi:hypothetical protein